MPSLAKLRTLLLFIPAVTVNTVLCGATSMALAVVFRSGEPSHRVASFWAWLVLKICRVQVELHGAENLTGSERYIIASNHQSLFDTAILFAYLPVSFRILYKKSLNRIPFLGWHLFLSGHIPVERENPGKARESLRYAAERILNGVSVVVFPEGTRSFDGVMRNFKKGSFVLAVRTRTPVVPITIADSHLVMKRGEVTVSPRTVRVYVSPCVDPSDYSEETVTELASHVQGIIRDRLRASQAHA